MRKCNVAMAESEEPTDWKSVMDSILDDPELLQSIARFTNTKFTKGQTPLHLAVMEGDLELFRKILSSTDGNEWMGRKAKGGWTALHLAARQDNPEFVGLLLDKKADTNLLNSEHASALHSAARDGTVEIVQILVESAGMSVNSQTKWGWTPLHCAAKSRKADVLQFLLGKGADVFLQTESGWLAFHWSCKVGSLDCCLALLRSTDGKGQSQMLSAKTQNNRTPLFCAVEGVKGAHTGVVKWLVEDCRVPVDDRDKNLYTPLHIASKLGFTEIAEYLLKHGASVDSRSEDSYTALHWAARYNKVGIVDLIKQRADLNVQNNMKDTALHIARKYNHEEVFEKIRDAGADMRIKNEDGLKPEDVSSGIPPEILSRGHASIQHFKDALKHGKTTPHRMKLMLLGDARVGKTSLYRYLSGQKFIEDLSSTEGIDTSLISTPEVEVGNTIWKKINSPHSDFDKKIAQATAASILAAETPRLLIEELPSHDNGMKMATEHSAEGNKEHKDQASKTKPVTTDAIVRQSTSVQDSPNERPGNGQYAHPKQDQDYKDTKHQQLPSQRQPGEKRLFSGLASAPKLPVDGVERKPNKKRRKPRKKPNPQQYDFSDIPVKEIQKFLKSDDHTSDEKVKFCVWDFAGQRLYEPMHHAFLTRRALYLIVFNLDELKGGISEADLQRIYFWVASVHTHTPLESEPVRIFFVGTHRDSPNATQEQIEMAIEQLRDCFQRSGNFSIHVEYVRSGAILATIENSSDNYEDADICGLRESLVKVALKQSYMQEEIPLTWLQYEDEIFRKFHQLSNQGSSTRSLQQQQHLLSIQEMKEIATQCQVDVTGEPFKTMITFFHDVSLILYPAAMQELDLEMKEALEDVVVPNPQFLVNLMTNLVKIPESHEQSALYRPDWLILEEQGVLTHRLMTHIVHELQGYSLKYVDILSKLLQALGFICKLVCPMVTDAVATTDYLTKKLESVTLDQKKDGSGVQGDAVISAATNVKYLSDVRYLVPSQLPSSDATLDELGNDWRGEFFFDFPRFLPPWLFQHFIVRLVALMQQTEDSRTESLRLPSKVCVVGQHSGVNFTVRLLRKRLVVRHQLSETSPLELMKWLFDFIVKISEQKFKNLTFSCGSLCPHVKCLKLEIQRRLTTVHINAEAMVDVFNSKEFMESRRRRLPAVRCLQDLRQCAARENAGGSIKPLIDSIDAMLSIARNNGHVEKIYSYDRGRSRHAKLFPCLLSDPDETISTNCVSSDNAGQQPEVTAAAFSLGWKCGDVPAVSLPQAVVTGKSAEVTDDDFFCGNPNERVRLKLLVQLAEQLTSNSCFKLKFFIAKLDFEREDLEQFLKYTSDVQEQCFDVLTTWQKRAGDQATIGNLRDALRQAASWFFTDADTVEASTCADQPKALQDDTQALSLPIHVQQDGLRTSVTTETHLSDVLRAGATSVDVLSQHSATSVQEKMTSPLLKTSVSISQPAGTSSYTSNVVLRSVQKSGSSRYYPIGLAMGFTHDEVERITSQRFDPADKLLALFVVQAEKEGVQSAEALLLDACKNIEPPVSI